MKIVGDIERIMDGLGIASLDDIEFLFSLGNLLTKKKTFIEAKRVFSKIVELQPRSYLAWFKKGNALEDLGRYEEANECFDKSIEINKAFPQAYSNKGLVLGKLGKFEESISFFDEALKLKENLPDTWYNRGQSLIRLHRYSDAIKSLDKAIKVSPISSQAYLEALLSKGFALSNLERYDEAIDCYNSAIKSNPSDWRLWINQGVALGRLGKYEEEIKCYDKALETDPCIVIALSNKGIALANFGRIYKEKDLSKYVKYFEESLNSFDKGLALNPNDEKLWFNKGVSLSDLGRHEAALECYEKAIHIDNNLAEAHGNKGVLFLNTHKYQEAEEELRIACKLFSNEGQQKDVDIAKDYIELAINARDLFEKFDHIDGIFKKCILSSSLAELKEKIADVSKLATAVIKDFNTRKLPDDIKELLISKNICISTLQKSINFEEFNLDGLKNARNVFEKWGLDDYIIAINSLDTFIRYLRKYKSLDDVPTEVESILLFSLKDLCVLDGALTGEISHKIKGEQYKSKTVDIENMKINEIIIPINVPESSIRICLVQLDFAVTETFPYELKDKSGVKNKILKALEVAHKENVNIICFPELSFSKDFLSDVNNYKNIIIICGSFYYDRYNVCPLLINGEEYHIYKINPSPYEETEIIPNKGIKCGKDIKIFSTRNNQFRFAVLICWDFIVESNKLYLLNYNSDRYLHSVFNPSYNSDKDRFQRKADTDCENYHVDLMQVNVNRYGGTCIIGVEHRNTVKRLKNEGCRPDDSVRFKLCEANGEMIIIADLNFKGIEVPPSVGAKPRLRIHKSYVFTEGSWEEKHPPWWGY